MQILIFYSIFSQESMKTFLLFGDLYQKLHCKASKVFVGYVKKNESFRWPDLALVVLVFCKKWTFQCEVWIWRNKTGPSKVGAISKAQKNLKFLNFFLSENVAYCRKCKRGDPLGFINIYSVAKHQKTRKGDSFETLKNFRKKSRTMPKKIERGTL